MRVLVTGAAGFLGQHVVRALVRRWNDVVALDRRPCSFADETDRAVSVLADVTDPGMGGSHHLRDLNAIIHLAAIASPRECEADPRLAMAINVGGTVNVLRLAAMEPACSVVLASTAHCYGIPPRYMPTDEAHPVRPHDAYTISKILAEDACRLFHSSHGVGFVSLRLSNGYGPGQPEGYFVPDMVVKARRGGIDLAGADVTKDFLYVGDMVGAIMAAAETSYVGALNIGSGTETSLWSMAGHIAQMLDVSLHAVPGPDGGRMCLDPSKARRVLGWEPSCSIVDGLKATIRPAMGN